MPEIDASSILGYSDYRQIRANARNGDVLMVSGSGPISLMIRAATFSRMSHVALLLWIDEGLWVFEAKEFQGLRFMPASLYVKDAIDSNTGIYFGLAPYVVHTAGNIVYDTAMNYRKASYGYRALFSVLAAQLASRWFKGVKVDSDAVVCSILIQRVWEACGHDFSRLMSPGMFTDECRYTVPIRSMSEDEAAQD